MCVLLPNCNPGVSGKVGRECNQWGGEQMSPLAGCARCLSCLIVAPSVV